MNFKPDSAACARAYDGFAAFLYGELEGTEREFLETHLADCAACHTRLATQRATLSLLDDWRVPAPAGTEKPAEIAERVRLAKEASLPPLSPPFEDRPRPSRRARWVRLSAQLTGAAAAILVALALLGTEFSAANGEYHLRLRMPWTRATPPSPVQLPEQELRRIAADEVTNQTLSWEEQLRTWSLERANERDRFVLAVDRSKEQDRRAILALNNLIQELSRRQMLQDIRTKDALVELTEAILVLSD